MIYATAAVLLASLAAAHPHIYPAHHLHVRRNYNESAAAALLEVTTTSTATAQAVTDFVYANLVSIESSTSPETSSSSSAATSSLVQDTTTTLIQTSTRTITVVRTVFRASSTTSSPDIDIISTTSATHALVTDESLNLNIAAANHLHSFSGNPSVTDSTLTTSVSTSSEVSPKPTTTSPSGPSTRYVTVVRVETVYRATLTGGMAFATGVMNAAAINTDPAAAAASSSSVLTYHFPTLSRRVYPTGAFGGVDAWREERRDRRWFGLREKKCMEYGLALVGCHQG